MWRAIKALTVPKSRLRVLFSSLTLTRYTLAVRPQYNHCTRLPVVFCLSAIPLSEMPIFFQTEAWCAPNRSRPIAFTARDPNHAPLARADHPIFPQNKLPICPKPFCKKTLLTRRVYTIYLYINKKKKKKIYIVIGIRKNDEKLGINPSKTTIFLT